VWEEEAGAAGKGRKRGGWEWRGEGGNRGGEREGDVIRVGVRRERNAEQGWVRMEEGKTKGRVERKKRDGKEGEGAVGLLRRVVDCMGRDI